MPEAPEVETVRRTLEAVVVGRRIEKVDLRRPDYVHGDRRPIALLEGAVIARLDRHGKQLAIAGSSKRCLCVHLGMSGQVRAVNDQRSLSLSHAHLIWRLNSDHDASTPARLVVFRDPRRFGGIWTFPSMDQLRNERWSKLGPDALSITHEELIRNLSTTRRWVKTALLDQRVIAGLGNIYCDEALYRARVRPTAEARKLSPTRIRRLVDAIRITLSRAIEAGGSTFRDHRDATGARGTYLDAGLVYGRAGQPCPHCGRRLRRDTISQRTTVWCARCQRP